MRLLKVVLSLAVLALTSLLLSLLFFSTHDYSASPRLRHNNLELSVIPCGERELHDAMVQFITEHEPRYLHCLLLEREDRAFRSPECSQFSRSHTDMLRRLHSLRNDQEKNLRIVQIGTMGDRRDDPLYQAMYEPHLYNETSEKQYWPPYSLDGLVATVVEPTLMASLVKQYASWSREIDSLHFSNFKFVDKAVMVAENINADGKCLFYTVANECPLEIKWVSQIGAQDPSYLKKIFMNDTQQCIKQGMVPCVTVSGLMSESGHDLILKPTPGGQQQQQQMCSPPVSSSIGLAKPVTDVLIVNTGDLDGKILIMTLKELCPEIWPSIILYEDKELRFASKNYNNDNNMDDDEHPDTEVADSVIDFLEQRGYYVLLFGDNAIALRVGYSIDAMRHSLYDPPDLSIFRQKAWLHPRSSRTVH